MLVSIGALVWIGRRLDHAQLRETMHHAELGWFIAAAVAFLLALALGAWRWHQMLRLTGTSMSLPISCQLTVVGHCFSTFLFGLAVSDVAKASLYSRWHGFPIARVLAASALDRTIGATSTLIYALCTAGLAVWAAPRFPWREVEVPSPWMALGVVALLMIIFGGVLWFTRRLWMGAWSRLVTEMRRAFVMLWQRPALAFATIGVGLIIQVLVSTVLGCCLRAVHPTALPWTSLLWTFPVIGVAASMPVTISGAGARDGAAILLWAAFGVTATEAFSASLLTLSVNLFWALAGLILLFLSRRAMASETTS